MSRERHKRTSADFGRGKSGDTLGPGVRRESKKMTSSVSSYNIHSKRTKPIPAKSMVRSSSSTALGGPSTNGWNSNVSVKDSASHAGSRGRRPSSNPYMINNPYANDHRPRPVPEGGGQQARAKPPKPKAKAKSKKKTFAGDQHFMAQIPFETASPQRARNDRGGPSHSTAPAHSTHTRKSRPSSAPFGRSPTHANAYGGSQFDTSTNAKSPSHRHKQSVPSPSHKASPRHGKLGLRAPSPRHKQKPSHQTHQKPLKSPSHKAAAAKAQDKHTRKFKSSILRGYQPQDPNLQFRSVALQLEVAVTEKLKHVDPTRASAQLDRKEIFVALFNDIIEHDRTYGRLLARVKEAYEEYVIDNKTHDAQRMQDKLVDENRKLHDRLDHYAKAYQELFEGRTDMSLQHQLLASTLVEKESKIKELTDRLAQSGLKVDSQQEKGPLEGQDDTATHHQLIERNRMLEYHMLKLQTELEVAQSREMDAVRALQGGGGARPHPGSASEDTESDEDDESLLSGEWTNPPLVNHKPIPTSIPKLKLELVGPDSEDDEPAEEQAPVQAQQEGYYDEAAEEEMLQQQEDLVRYCMDMHARGEPLPEELLEMLDDMGIELVEGPAPAASATLPPPMPT